MTTIAFLGPHGTFTDAACARLERTLPEPHERLDCATPAAALEAVRTGRADYACVPIENSIDGPVTPSFDALALSPRVQILAETELPIEFAILVRPGTTAAEVRTLATHPVAAAQVSRWVSEHMPHATVETVSSTAAGAQRVAEGHVDAAAAPARAAELFDLDILAASVADYDTAVTRFVLVGQPQVPVARTGSDRTSVVVELPNEPGSLVTVLLEFASRGVDLARLLARPTKEELGVYVFHIDIHGHITDPLVAESLRGVYRHATTVQYLGSWPAYNGDPHRTPPAAQTDAQWLEGLLRGEA